MKNFFYPRKVIIIACFCVLFFTSFNDSNATTSIDENISAKLSSTKETSNKESNNNVLNEQDKKNLRELRDYIDVQPKALKEEILLFRSQLKQLQQQREDYYNLLSDEAKDFIAKESELKGKLSIQARKEFFRKNFLK